MIESFSTGDIPPQNSRFGKSSSRDLRWRMVRKCVMRTGWRGRETRESSRKGGMNEMTARCVSMDERNRCRWRKCKYALTPDERGQEREIEIRFRLGFLESKNGFSGGVAVGAKRRKYRVLVTRCRVGRYSKGMKYDVLCVLKNTHRSASSHQKESTVIPTQHTNTLWLQA
jgi:hypothetical protein